MIDYSTENQTDKGIFEAIVNFSKLPAKKSDGRFFQKSATF